MFLSNDIVPVPPYWKVSPALKLPLIIEKSTDPLMKALGPDTVVKETPVSKPTALVLTPRTLCPDVNWPKPVLVWKADLNFSGPKIWWPTGKFVPKSPLTVVSYSILCLSSNTIAKSHVATGSPLESTWSL